MFRVSKTVFVGLEGDGKSLLLAQESYRLVHRNHNWNKITGQSRPIVSNLPYSQNFLQFAKSKGVEIKYWQHISELEKMSECDLIIDELSTYFDSRGFENLPLSTRLWLAQAEKMGVDIYGTAQDFGQVDKSFRRLCKKVILVRKIIGSRRPMKTAPPVKRVWGIIGKWEIDPRGFDGDQSDMKTLNILPSFFLIKKKDVGLFDTQQRIQMSSPPPLIKIVRTCEEDGYTKVRYV